MPTDNIFISKDLLEYVLRCHHEYSGFWQGIMRKLNGSTITIKKWILGNFDLLSENYVSNEAFSET